MKKNRRKIKSNILLDRKKGFTLVELIVVLVILAILAAILAPALLGYIDKAKEKKQLLNCRACVESAQGLLSQDYAHNKENAKIDDLGEIITLADVPGKVTGYSSEGGKLTHLTYVNQDVLMVYCSAGGCALGHTQTYNYGVDGLQITDDSSPGATVRNILESISLQSGTSIDSTSPSGKNKRIFLQAMKEAGISFDNFNVKSWAVRSNGHIWMTDQDISTLDVGTRVRVLKYNPTLNTYTAGYVTVETTTAVGEDGKSATYNIVNPGNKDTFKEYGNSQNDETKQSYATTVGFFNQMSVTEEK